MPFMGIYLLLLFLSASPSAARGPCRITLPYSSPHPGAS